MSVGLPSNELVLQSFLAQPLKASPLHCIDLSTERRQLPLKMPLWKGNCKAEQIHHGGGRKRRWLIGKPEWVVQLHPSLSNVCEGNFTSLVDHLHGLNSNLGGRIGERQRRWKDSLTIKLKSNERGWVTNIFLDIDWSILQFTVFTPKLNFHIICVASVWSLVLTIVVQSCRMSNNLYGENTWIGFYPH